DPVSVTIPAGVDSGSQIRVPGEGSAGPFGGPRGDLLISTRVQEHPLFGRKGDSVHCEVPISVWEAILGARIRVPTPLGEAALVVPPGTTGGQVFRLRGQGLPKLSGEGIGDLYVTVRVEIPTGLDARPGCESRRGRNHPKDEAPDARDAEADRRLGRVPARERRGGEGPGRAGAARGARPGRLRPAQAGRSLLGIHYWKGRA